MAVAQLVVFLRTPLPGQTKTRLAEAVGNDRAAALYAAFAEDTLALCQRVAAASSVDVALWHAGPRTDHIARWAESVSAKTYAQPSGTLGDRLEAAFSSGLRVYERVVAIGSDAPTLPASLLASTFDALATARLVLGPTSDGGYYAIGASEGRTPSFEHVRWSTEHAYTDTRRANPNTPFAATSPWYDVDRAEDLELLRAHLSLDPGAATATATALGVVRHK
ncbi:MAG: TIGR04282 family arsenosugar biosynthesis glycosyltransferase [Myxococcota bacterium]